MTDDKGQTTDYGTKTTIRHPPSGVCRPYAELAVTSNFSFLRGASHPEELVERAQELGLAAIGIADRNSVAGVVRAHTAAKEKGFKIVIGARLVFADGTPDILAYPQDRAAWGRLTRLLTVGKSRADKGDCILFLDDLLEHIAGLNLIVVPQRISQLRHPEVAGHKRVYARLRRAMADPRSHPSRLLPIQALDAPVSGNPEISGRRPSRLRLKAAEAPQGDGEIQKNLLQRLCEAAPRSVWLAASMLYRGDDQRRLARTAAIASEAGIPLIAVNDVLYHAPERRLLQDIVTCIREHTSIDAAGRLLEANAERHLKAADEMVRLFRHAPEAIEQTLVFLERCRFSLDDLRYEYPDETRAGYATPQEALAAFVEEGARRRYPGGISAKIRRALDHELAVTAELNYAPYFLTVHDIVRFARSKGILCQGRGSAANSVICYCLGITEVDPERIDLLFERFVSAERREPPDIDVDFEHERREEVIQYIYRTYTRERAGISATVNCYRGRSAIREVGKAFGLSEDVVGVLASTLWGWSMSGVKEEEVRRAGLDPGDARLKQAIALADELRGFPRHLSQHVGGFVITRSRLDEVVPVENAAMEERTVIEWDKDDLNDLGILKIDVLGLGMLSCLRRSFDLLKEYYCHSENTHPASLVPLPLSGEGVKSAIPLSLAALQDEDPAVYRMLARADSIGVFQVESRAQMSMLPRLRPKKFYDLVIEVAIVRPGPIQGDMVHPYLRRRQGLEQVFYPAPAPEQGPPDELEQVLKKTLGVPLFQEQAMRIAIVAAGFPAAKADRLRRAMATFKRVGTIDRFRNEFVEGMTARGYPRAFAARCFQQIEGFGEYGFPESHAASFANLVYASAWIKCHYPDVFAAALLNSQPMGFYAPAQIVRDAQEHGVAVRPVDVNFSDWDCTLEALCHPLKVEGICTADGSSPPGLPPASLRPAASPFREEVKGVLHSRHAEMKNDIRSTHAVRLGFRQISGLSEDHARQIERVRGNGFDSVRDLWLRSRLSSTVLKRLAEADAFRSLGLSRRDALWAVRALQRSGDKDDLPLFRRVAMPELEGDADLPPMLLGEQVVEDYRHLHLSLKAHPVSFLRAELTRRGILRHEQLAAIPSGRHVTVAGLVLVRQRPDTASGVIFMTLEDETAVANTIVWPAVFERFRPIVLGARLIAVTGKLQNESGVIHVVSERMEDLSGLLQKLSQAPTDCVDATVRCDAVKYPVQQPARLPGCAPAHVGRVPADEGDANLAHAQAAMPKGRNFR